MVFGSLIARALANRNNFNETDLRKWLCVIENVIQIRRLNQSLKWLQGVGVSISAEDQQKIMNEKERLEQLTIDMLKKELMEAPPPFVTSTPQ